MPKLKILPHEELCPDGAEFELNAEESICQQLLNNGIAIEHACDMVCACTTCHIIVKSGFATLNSISDLEEDMLDRAWGLKPSSRLSCQAIAGDQDIEIEIPKYSINQVKEG